MNQALLQTVVPILVVGAVLTLRFRSMAKAQPLNSRRLLIAPLLLLALGCFALATNPPTLQGWSICLAALVLGAVIGWQRGKMTRVWRDEKTGKLMQQASPAAMILLLVIIALRFGLRNYFGAAPSADGHISPSALLVTDALLTFAIGLIGMNRLELALRACGLRTPA